MPAFHIKLNEEGPSFSEDFSMVLRLATAEQDQDGRLPCLISDAGLLRLGYPPCIVSFEPEQLKEISVSYDSDMLTEYLLENASVLPKGDYNYMTIADGVIGFEQNYYKYWAKSYFDYSGNPLFQYPEFPDTVRIADSSVCSGGSIALLLIGADSHYYVTAVNRDGSFKYSPLDINDYCERPSQTIRFSNGYIDIGNGYFVTPEGQITQRDGFWGISENLNVVNFEDEIEPYFSDGFGFFQEENEINWYILSWDGAVQNDFVTVDEQTVNGAECLNQLNETDSTPVQNPGKTSSAPMESKNYQAINNFSIEGKWKNIGSETFGQAQQGAIIVFDGINCNFFSPKDTYAFSKDGDHYCSGRA